MKKEHPRERGLSGMHRALRRYEREHGIGKDRQHTTSAARRRRNKLNRA